MSADILPFGRPAAEKPQQPLIELRETPDTINFGELPEEIDELLQKGVVAYRTDRAKADALFREALAQAPQALPVYFCLYKIHTYQGNLEKGVEAAEGGLREAAAQAGWPADWRAWTPQEIAADMPVDGAGRFALYTLKALAFIHLRMHEREAAMEMLDALRALDPTGAVGWPVVAELANGVD
jgi:tetratricopeptide (TPR) repeat protein